MTAVTRNAARQPDAGYGRSRHRRVTWVTQVLRSGRSWCNRQILGPGAGEPAQARLDPSWPAFLRIGHRGAGALEPENTLRGIEAALRYGVEMVEIDVRPCADGTLVLMHDDDLRRTTGREGRVSASTWAELRTLTVGKGERIATLEDALALLRGRALVNLDQKRGVAPDALLGAIDRAGRREETLLTGRGRESFPLFRELAPSVRLACGGGGSWKNAHRIALARYTAAGARGQAGRIITRAHAAQAHGASIDWHLATAGVVERLHRAGLPVLTWTVDDLPTMRALRRAGVHGITSNRPDLLVRLR
jgi:glycerophosphoryl diester phosphodiesterase